MASHRGTALPSGAGGRSRGVQGNGADVLRRMRPRRRWVRRRCSAGNRRAQAGRDGPRPAHGPGMVRAEPRVGPGGTQAFPLWSDQLRQGSARSRRRSPARPPRHGWARPAPRPGRRHGGTGRRLEPLLAERPTAPRCSGDPQRAGSLRPAADHHVRAGLRPGHVRSPDARLVPG